MRHPFIALAFAGAMAMLPLAAQAQVMEPSYGGPITADDARDIAAENGVSVIDSIELDRGDARWEIEGRDMSGRDVDLEVDANTGAVLEVER